MFKKYGFPTVLIAAALLVTAGILFHAQPVQASNATFADGGTSSCLTCHENRYFQYDTGNIYCLTEASARCVDCHGGDPNAPDEATAHAGMLTHPIVNGDISRCETCHGTAAQSHVDTFAALAGYSETVIVADQVQPSAAQAAEAAPVKLDGKMITGITVIATVLAGLFVFCFFTNKSCH